MCHVESNWRKKIRREKHESYATNNHDVSDTKQCHGRVSCSGSEAPARDLSNQFIQKRMKIHISTKTVPGASVRGRVLTPACAPMKSQGYEEARPVSECLRLCPLRSERDDSPGLMMPRECGPE